MSGSKTFYAMLTTGACDLPARIDDLLAALNHVQEICMDENEDDHVAHILEVVSAALTTPSPGHPRDGGDPGQSGTDDEAVDRAIAAYCACPSNDMRDMMRAALQAGQPPVTDRP